MQRLGFVLIFAAILFVGCGRVPSQEHVSPDLPSAPLGAGDPLSTESAETSMIPRDLPQPDIPVVEKTKDRAELMAEADRIAMKDPGDAAAILRQVLLMDPTDIQALFLLATVTAATNDLKSAIALLDEIPSDHPEAGLPAIGQSADWCFQLDRYEEAERRYRLLIEQVPSASRARRQLAYLLNRQGRRQEASVHVRVLCRQGNIRQDELHSLISLSSAMYDDPTDETKASPASRPYWPIGPAGMARELFSRKKFRDAADQLHPMVAQGQASPSVLALYGRAVSESQDDKRFQWWLSLVNEETQKYSEYWAAIGTMELSEQRFEPALRALGEAIDRDPTDLASISRLRQALKALNEDALAQLWQDHWYAVQETLKLNNQIAATQPADPDLIAQLSESLIGINRPLEALLWKSLAIDVSAENAQGELELLNAQRKRLLAAKRSFPSTTNRLYGSKLLSYPLPKSVSNSIASFKWRPTDSPTALPLTPAVFENVSQPVGLTHTYQVAKEPIENGFSIYQQLGGGVAVCDYDLDGACDLYFAQGGGDPPSYQGHVSNQLFRQQSGSLVDVTRVSGLWQDQFTVGVTSGDWNQDGFPDLVVANIGTHTLMINNGDGTFTNHTLSKKPNLQRVPSSIAMADMTGDAIPDLYFVHYVDDRDIARKPPRDKSGRILDQISPGDFQYASDQLFINDGKGGIESLTESPIARLQSNPFPGLGVLVADLDGEPGSEVFVGNDLYPNQLWSRAHPQGPWSDEASLLGCAFGFGGVATGSMGIASADFDNNGTLDIHIANFENQYSSLFIQDHGAYRDRCVQYGLDSSTEPMVGFGSQSIDYDNDGLPDLVVTNGQLDESVQNTSPFRQPCQLFRNILGKFELIAVKENSGYWKHQHLGRGLARLDFNADGKSDFVVTHLGEPSALLVNQTPDLHHWLQVRLVGTQSERDGIGACVRVSTGHREFTQWLTAGDGYLCRNEAVVSFGLGNATQAEVTVDWPSGETQVIGAVSLNQRILVIESQGVHREIAP